MEQLNPFPGFYESDNEYHRRKSILKKRAEEKVINDYVNNLTVTVCDSSCNIIDRFCLGEVE